MFDQLSRSRSFARKTFVSCIPCSSRILLVLALRQRITVKEFFSFRNSMAFAGALLKLFSLGLYNNKPP